MRCILHPDRVAAIVTAEGSGRCDECALPWIELLGRHRAERREMQDRHRAERSALHDAEQRAD
jgi:hypothetical protein